MAIVIPVAMDGLRVANAAGVSADRKRVATEIAERILNEAILTGQWQAGIAAGVVWQDQLEYHYALRTEPWMADPLQLHLQIVTAQVTFSVQGRSHAMSLSTLAGGAAP